MSTDWLRFEYILQNSIILCDINNLSFCVEFVSTTKAHNSKVLQSIGISSALQDIIPSTFTDTKRLK